VGAGLGIAFTDQSFVYGPGININDNDTNFAGQVIVGVAYDLTERVSLTLDGRYQRIFDAASPRLTAAGVNTGNVTGDIDNFGVNIGLRFKF
ncbi:MAG: P44/Msp2 family outer membrane protein, partial [Pseudomonadota bacterium]